MNTYPELILAMQAGQPGYPALDYGISLADCFRSPVTILGVKKASHAPRLSAEIDKAQKELDALGIPVEAVWERGSFENALLGCLSGHPDALTLFSDVRKPFLDRYVRNARFRHLMAAVQSPLMRVQRACLPPRHMLVCSGGLAYTIPLEKLAIQIASVFSAKITFFHVVEPVTLEYELSREIRDHWETLLKTDTPQAHHLNNARQAAQKAGVDARVHVRHGTLIHELFDEIRSGGYDFVAVGSAYSSHTLRHLTRPDVAALVAATFDCPLLTARGKITDTYG
jgi:nucleotide-binding universal stress UspA family protein